MSRVFENGIHFGAYSLSTTDFDNPIYCVSYKNNSSVPSNRLAIMSMANGSYLYFGTSKIVESDRDVEKYSFENITGLTIYTYGNTNPRSIKIILSNDTEITGGVETSGTYFELSGAPHNVRIEPNTAFETIISKIIVHYSCTL